MKILLEHLGPTLPEASFYPCTFHYLILVCLDQVSVLEMAQILLNTKESMLQVHASTRLDEK